MPRIYIDFETRGAIDLGGPGKPGCGAHVYAAHPDTEILLMAWKLEEGSARIWWANPRFASVQFPNIWEPGWTVVAHNAPFERAMWREKMNYPDIPLENWEDTAARAYMCGLPGKLEKATQALGLKHQKDMVGHKLMMQMCKPKRLGKRELIELAVGLGLTAEEAESEMRFILNSLKSDPSAPSYLRPDYRRFFKWKEDGGSLQRLGEYCAADVMAEYELDKVLPVMPAKEREIWELDQRVNDRGIRVDLPAVRDAIAMIEKHEAKLTRELQELTNGEVKTAKSSAAFAKHMGMENVQKGTVEDALKTETNPVRQRVLEIRQSLGQSSVSKFQAMVLATDPRDQRVRGMFAYHGGHTGRWAGRLIQPQNFVKGDQKRFENPDDIIAVMALRDPEVLEVIWGDPVAAAANCLRGMLVPSGGKQFEVADYSSIEGRGLAWVAGEEHVLQGYRDGKCAYRVDAATIFKVPYEVIKNPSKERDVGKTANLACGYFGGVAAMKRFGADKLGLSDGELKDIVKKWRGGHPMTVKLWEELDKAAMAAVQYGGVHEYRGIKFGIKGPYLCMKLPSGRLLRYYAPRIENVVTPWGGTRDAVTVMTVHPITKQWVRRPMHGGLWTENLVQALCRDILAEAMLRLDKAGYEIILHIHDEIGNENAKPDLARFSAIMSEVPAWAEGFPIAAHGWVGNRFKKD